jgi:hypothetical protein
MLRRIVKVGVFTLSAYFILSLGASNLAAYVDLIAVIFVVFPIAFIAAFLSWRYDAPSSPLMHVLGVPLGLLGVSLGLISIFSGISDFNALAPATAILLLTILYGGTISGLGYLWGGAERSQMPKIPYHSALICGIPLVSVVYMASPEDLALLLGSDCEALVLLALVITLSMISFTSDPIVKRVTHATILVILILAILGIIDLAMIGANTMYADPDTYLQGMAKIYMSINTGLMIYIFCIIWSITAGVFDDIDFGKINWHLVEAFSLIVLITISPPSLYHFVT